MAISDIFKVFKKREEEYIAPYNYQVPEIVDRNYKCKYKILINPKDWQKLLLYARNVKGEISGLGTVIRKGNTFTLQDMFITKQHCSEATTTLDEDDLQEVFYKYVKGGGDPSKWCLWWHVHPEGCGAFWSNTDKETHALLSKDKEQFISLVLTAEGEYQLRLELNGKEISTDLPLDFAVYKNITEFEKETKEIKAEIKKKVKTLEDEIIEDLSDKKSLWETATGWFHGNGGDHVE